MSDKQAKLGRFSVFVLATAIVALGISAQQSSHTRIPLVTDWSSRHLIFSTPSTAAKLAEVSQDPRFQQQWLRRNLHPAPPTDGEDTIGASEVRGAGLPGGSIQWGVGGGRSKASLKRDWSTSLGPNATIGADTYPAKFSFDSSTASCANDFVVYGTSVTGAAAGANAAATGTFSSTGPNDGDTATLSYGSGSVATITASAAEAASNTGTFTGNPTNAQTATIGGSLVLKAVPGGQVTFNAEPASGDTLTVGSTMYAFANSPCTTSPCIVRSSTTSTDATNLQHAISNVCSAMHTDCEVTAANTSVTASAAGSVVTLTTVASPPAASYALSTNDANTAVAVGARGTGSNTGDNFVVGVTNGSSVSVNDATSLANDIAANGGGVGVTATSTGATVTVSATTAGTGGNSITLAEGLSNFTWAGTTLAGGAAPQTGDNFFAITNATGTALSLGTITNNFATAVTNESFDVGVPVTGSAAGDVVTLAPTASAPGSLGNGVGLTESMTNFVWNHTTMTGGVGQANIVAYSNLYSSCTAPVPTTFWSYFTGGTVQTSPVLSLDGKQVAFVQTTGTTASLVLLKWASASVTAGSPVTLTTTTASAYSSCSAPCMLTLAFNDGDNDTNSSPYYDYSGDALYVGDDNGTLHKFTPIFNGGTPAEIITSPWPVALTGSGGMQTTGPVYALNNGIYIASARTSNSGTTGGYLYRVNPTTGAVTSSAEISRVPGILDAPIVDPSAGEVYAFVSTDDTGDCTFGANCNGVFQFGTAFAAAAAGTEKEVGSQTLFGTALPLFTGDFDNTYFNSSDPPTGSLYVCGNVGGTVEIFRIPITTNTMGTVVTGPAITSGSTTCSPITEADSGTVDTIFVNVQNRGNVGNCTGGGCVMSFTVTSGTLPSGTAPAASLAESGGTSGVVIDTLGSSTAGANQVYFTPLGTGAVCPTAAGCAIQASQSGLN
jgi:hypothetical protein